MTISRSFFISDLHLCETHPETVNLFFQFLEITAKSADALYILGDLFEFWVGDDDSQPFNEKIKLELRRYTSSGIPTYFMRGNRDFLIRERFAREAGVILIPEPTAISLYGEKSLLLHGDSLCTLDTLHQKSRKLIHNRFYQNLFLCLPLSIRNYFGKRFRSASRERKNFLSKDIMDVTFEEVRKVMSKSKVSTLIHGHTHRHTIHEFNLNEKPSKRLALGAWHEKGNYLEAFSNGELYFGSL